MRGDVVCQGFTHDFVEFSFSVKLLISQYPVLSIKRCQLLLRLIQLQGQLAEVSGR